MTPAEQILDFKRSVENLAGGTGSFLWNTLIANKMGFNLSVSAYNGFVAVHQAVVVVQSEILDLADTLERYALTKEEFRRLENELAYLKQWI